MNYAHSKHLILIYFISDLTSFVAHLTHQWGKKFQVQIREKFTSYVVHSGPKEKGERKSVYFFNFFVYFSYSFNRNERRQHNTTSCIKFTIMMNFITSSTFEAGKFLNSMMPSITDSHHHHLRCLKYEYLIQHKMGIYL